MIDFISHAYRQLGHRLIYGAIATLVALGIVVANPHPGQALPWAELLFRGIQVIQLSTLSDRQEVALGGQINEQLTSQEFQLYTNTAINRYVDEVGQSLVPHSDRPNIPYTFQVVNDSRINAFATMGGYVYVTTGLLKAADNEAQLAGVVGHEIGHIAGRHAVEQMREATIAQGVASATGLSRNQAVQIGVELALRRPNSRQDEFEADSKGLSTIKRAGYAPIAMVDFLQKLVRQGGSLPSFLSTHPATQERIRALQTQITPSQARTGYGLNNAEYRQRISALL